MFYISGSWLCGVPHGEHSHCAQQMDDGRVLLLCFKVRALFSLGAANSLCASVTGGKLWTV